MQGFEELVQEACAADVGGWGFGWLDGRATEERPPWGFSSLLSARLRQVRSALDIDTGGGEVVAGVPVLPARMAVTESWPPNARRARELLGPRGVRVVETRGGEALPFDDESFELVTSRHPICPDWSEIARVLEPGGRYLAQHVGPESAFDLIERFVEVTPEQRTSRHPDGEAAAARTAGLDVLSVRRARCRMEFTDVGAVVYLLRKCVWWVPGFDVDRHGDALRRIDEEIRETGILVAYSARHLVEARKAGCDAA